ncbi:sensor histidine kinase [Hymenobacter crusticola]|uniref:Signal transduction histidine kinase internal region domain-containing protein n=1 Tax=Hymenobacter crusticola TaxID=1770526 RepID=A0A243WBM5_9BACT|nr:sensor histidine kinase [Hymenobacter crusticola]OUJ72796.1 hypothetical protein BXP70_15885 [Hymenobacter crusticola]
MQTPSRTALPAAPPSRFPLVFEGLMWVLYVGLYKYSRLMEGTALGRRSLHAAFLHPQLILFALAATLYIVPYYRVLVPVLLRRRRYLLLGISAMVYLWWGIKLNMVLAHGLFQHVASPPQLAEFYHAGYVEATSQLLTRTQPYLSPLFIDLLTFSCVAFVRLAFQQEAQRHRVEKEHLALQMEQLKAQLQPHFLFNTLNSIYGLSLAGSSDTPRFILLLSELMRYVLYDSGKATVPLAEEVTFLENYFELEQRKYPNASIRFATLDSSTSPLQVPPLLLLPLVENSFKHGLHHHSDRARVEATLTTTPGQLCFTIENDMLPEAPTTLAPRSGGIGLQNIRQRLQVYYPSAHALQLSQQQGRYRAQLILHLPQ